MIRLKYGHLCDFATTDQRGKPIIVGIFDRVNWRGNSEKAAIPPCFLVGELEGSIADGSEHRLRVEIRDSNGGAVFSTRSEAVIALGNAGPGLPFVGGFRIQFANLSLPGADDYEIWFRVDGEKLSEVVAFSVVDLRET